MRSLTTLIAWLVLAAPAAAQPADFLSKVESMPDFLQTDKDGEFVKGGTRYCAPVAASNALIWLSRNGYPKLAPTGEVDKEIQIQLIRTLALPQFMDTEREFLPARPRRLHPAEGVCISSSSDPRRFTARPQSRSGPSGNRPGLKVDQAGHQPSQGARLAEFRILRSRAGG
jgi:hypothetical protein